MASAQLVVITGAPQAAPGAGRGRLLPTLDGMPVMASATALGMIDAHFRAMPPAAVMDLHVAGYANGTLRLEAPLALHVNDKGCAFGGSLASMMTLAAWGVVVLRLHDAGLAADVFVADCEVRYRAPLFADLVAEAALADEAGWTDALASVRAKGRASVQLQACVRLPDGGIAADARARYVVVAKG